MIDQDSDSARLTRHRDLFRIVHPDVAAANRAALCVADSGDDDMPPSMHLQLALQHVDDIVNHDFVAVSDETARRKGNPFAKRKVHMGDAREHAEHAARHLRDAWDRLEYIEKGLAEWRDMAKTNARHAEAARATARVAIGHLQAMLNTARNFKDQQDADTAARDWLVSIGSEPA